MTQYAPSTHFSVEGVPLLECLHRHRSTKYGVSGGDLSILKPDHRLYADSARSQRPRRPWEIMSLHRIAHSSHAPQCGPGLETQRVAATVPDTLTLTIANLQFLYSSSSHVTLNVSIRGFVWICALSILD